AGVLNHGVLTATLEAKEVLWQLNGPQRAPTTIEAFAESGHAPLMPGPLIRAPQGTELRLSIRNSLRLPLTFYLPAAVSAGGDSAMDSVVVGPGAVGRITARLTMPGTYGYRASTPTGASRLMQYAGVLAGALVVDSTNAPARPRDRVFVIMGTGDSAWMARADSLPASLGLTTNVPPSTRFIWTINGRAWPATERIRATVGDSLHWRIINASPLPHPMHLHGFYYRVEAVGGSDIARYGGPRPGQLVVTQLLSPFATMSMAWSPTRPGNWLFHCHIALHNMPDSVSAASDPLGMRGMTGLVMGVEVSGKPGISMAGAASPRAARRLRLIAQKGFAKIRSGRFDSLPSMRLVLQDGQRTVVGGPDFSPELDLVRGEPVAITIVNHLDEPTSVHWHGIEVQDSYADGVAGFSGEGKRLTPAIAPGDSFVARFAPPRAGTFMYHAHVDEVAQQDAGMEGALIVRDPTDSSSTDDHVFFLKGGREHPAEIDGRAVPDTVVLHVGRPARFRLMNLQTVYVAPVVMLTANPDSAMTRARDTMIVRWKPLAKDGYDVPLAAQIPAPALQDVADGETYDFLYTPTAPGMLHLEFRVSATVRRLIIRVPIRVE
ncbi:MAG TPA: multicopper oxidase domain-containing protein, partial [Gemmatimonadaceae bacterium]|nr:multicopper oxidase domain-containing protein [Gemmatimonadaceae bacterium]